MSDSPAPFAQKTISITTEMRKSYLDYAMSVIVSRAIPDVRDGLKPVHRRILYGMMESGFDYNKAFKKSARTVGDVMGKYHPHGDSAIYDALVRMAQPFSMSVMLIDGQGNFGSMDGDAAAAMRYTEARLAKITQVGLLDDIDKDTVSFQDNYDGSEQEPTVLPARYPNMLVNGAGGIAVGMATNIPPHNLGEVIDATCMVMDNPEVTIDELMAVIPGPDFPTGGIILGRTGSHSAAHTGRGSVIMRGKTEFEEIGKGRTAIIISEVPYQVNKAKLVERIAELVREKKIEGISDLRDESDKSGVRVVIEVKKDHVPDVVLNQLYSYSLLQTSFGVNQLALNGGRPQVMNLKDVLEAFIRFREEVISRRTLFLLNKVRDRAHNLIGLAIAVANIDEVIKVIRSSPDANVAREELMKRDWNAGDVLPLLELVDDKRNAIEGGRIRFTEEQTKAILELRLQRLTGLEREKIDAELQGLGEEITRFLHILSSRPERFAIMRGELLAIRDEFAVPRRTAIEESELEVDMESLIQKEDMVVTVTSGGYIKRVPLGAFRAQRRGGKGKSGISMRDEDVTEELFVANTHTPVLFFSNKGKVYKLKVYRLPLGQAQGRGKALVNLFPLEPGETIRTFMPLPEDEEAWNTMHIMFATSMGTIRRNDLSDFHDIRRNGKIAMKLEDHEELVKVLPCTEADHVMIAARSGKCIRFKADQVRVFQSRASTGVRAIKLGQGDDVVSMTVLKGTASELDERAAYLKFAAQKRRAAGTEDDSPVVPACEDNMEEGVIHEITLSNERLQALEEGEDFILTITANGYGKRSSSYEYRITNRGGSGIVNIVANERNGEVVASFPVKPTDQIILMTNTGKMIRTPVHDIRIAGRNTQGVRIFNVEKGEHVVSAVKIDESMIGTPEELDADDAPTADDTVALVAQTDPAEAAMVIGEDGK